MGFLNSLTHKRCTICDQSFNFWKAQDPNKIICDNCYDEKKKKELQAQTQKQALESKQLLEKELIELFKDHSTWSNQTINRVHILLESGANPNTFAFFGSLLARAVRASSAGLVQTLLNFGADPNYRPVIPHVLTFRPMEEAVRGLDQESEIIIKALIKAGADLTLRDEFGNTPLEYLEKEVTNRDQLWTSIVKYLRELQGQTSELPLTPALPVGRNGNSCGICKKNIDNWHYSFESIDFTPTLGYQCPLCGFIFCKDHPPPENLSCPHCRQTSKYVVTLYEGRWDPHMVASKLKSGVYSGHLKPPNS